MVSIFISCMFYWVYVFQEEIKMLLKEKLKYIQEEDSKYDSESGFFEQERKIFIGSILLLEDKGYLIVVEINREIKLMSLNGQIYNSLSSFENKKIIDEEKRGLLFIEYFMLKHIKNSKSI